jgi:hypothetical protein
MYSCPCGAAPLWRDVYERDQVRVKRAAFCDDEHIAKTGTALLCDMAYTPAANTLATTIKAIISTPPWGPFVFLIGVAFPMIVLLVIFWQLLVSGAIIGGLV